MAFILATLRLSGNIPVASDCKNIFDKGYAITTEAPFRNLTGMVPDLLFYNLEIAFVTACGVIFLK